MIALIASSLDITEHQQRVEHSDLGNTRTTLVVAPMSRKPPFKLGNEHLRILRFNNFTVLQEWETQIER